MLLLKYFIKYKVLIIFIKLKLYGLKVIKKMLAL